MAENRMEANTAASTSLNMLEDRLTNSLWKIHNLELSLQSTGSAGVVGQRLNELVEDMREIDNIGEALKDLKIPVELLQ
uniref:Mediator of RNA polymerase II transcription subunit 10 n=2 Tax=Tetraselmis sp. GSL018 TaxID=582737 RepID=A0A061QVE5_9CHLO|eukprot:CAMPEP_0177615282 /NCGR_PEP_ID=MMETSP0419_2-20121207/23331_1 /TAXON_ID=582737 /ORGANISM="Tetraselmis sp., Strain GSL018" /LENGTH=78 /DNA_ID=CAMNT_0019112847 /DNA_START=184 /DNA_END=420 /DNA_ORIENTATION=+